MNYLTILLHQILLNDIKTLEDVHQYENLIGNPNFVNASNCVKSPVFVIERRYDILFSRDPVLLS